MLKYKFSILFAVLFTIPLVGYFVVSGYLWLFTNSVPDIYKLMASLTFGTFAVTLNAFIAIEIES